MMGFEHKPEPHPSFHWYSDSLSDFSHISGRLDGLELDGCRWCHLLQPLTAALSDLPLVYSEFGQRMAAQAALGSVLELGQQIGMRITGLLRTERGDLSDL